MIDNQGRPDVVAQQRVMSNPYGHNLSPRTPYAGTSVPRGGENCSPLRTAPACTAASSRTNRHTRRMEKAIDKPEPVKQRQRSQHRMAPNPFMTVERSPRAFNQKRCKQRDLEAKSRDSFSSPSYGCSKRFPNKAGRRRTETGRRSSVVVGVHE